MRNLAKAFSYKCSDKYITNYSITRQDRMDKIGGGPVIYVCNGLLYHLRTDLQKNDIETCWVQIIHPNTKLLFVSSVYRAPDANVDNVIDNLSKCHSIIQENAIEVISLGDFNVDCKQRLTATSRLQTLARMFSFEQIITSATRIKNTSESIIHLIFFNNIHGIVASEVISLDISYHLLIFCVIKAGIAK